MVVAEPHRTAHAEVQDEERSPLDLFRRIRDDVDPDRAVHEARVPFHDVRISCVDEGRVQPAELDQLPIGHQEIGLVEQHRVARLDGDGVGILRSLHDHAHLDSVGADDLRDRAVVLECGDDIQRRL